MLEMVLDKQILVIGMGIGAAIGVLSKCVAGISLKRLVKASGNMNKSNHPLLKLIKAKFEHTCMISDRVQNVEVFVEKYLYEYRVAGFRLHTWRRLEKCGLWLCVIAGLAGAGLEYGLRGMTDQVLQYGAAGIGLAILLFVFQFASDEKYQMEAAKNYIVDYLENICARRYEKSAQREIKEEWKAMAPPAEPETRETAIKKETEKEPTPETPQRQETAPQPEITEPKKAAEPEIPQPQPEQIPQPAPQKQVVLESQLKAAQAAAEKVTARKAKRVEKAEKEESQEVRIREILEEFLA